MLSLGSFLFSAARRTLYSASKTAGLVLKSARRLRGVWLSSERWTSWTPLRLNALSSARSGSHRPPPCKKGWMVSRWTHSQLRRLSRRRNWLIWARMITIVWDPPWYKWCITTCPVSSLSFSSSVARFSMFFMMNLSNSYHRSSWKGKKRNARKLRRSFWKVIKMPSDRSLTPREGKGSQTQAPIETSQAQMSSK